MPFTRKKSRRSSTLLKQASRRTVSRLNRSEELKKSRTRMSSEKRKKELATPEVPTWSPTALLIGPDRV